MPRRNEPRSLQKETSLAIAKHFDLICYNCRSKKEMHELIMDDTYLTFESPFKLFPSSLLYEMMCTIRDEINLPHLNKRHLHHLILPHIESLKLTGDGGFGIKLLSERCQKLRHLDLSYMRNVNPPVLVKLIPKLEHVVYLNLSMTDTVDQVLYLIGKHCPEIRELHIAQCPITENGIRKLCYDIETGQPMCQKLTRLNMTGCMISARPLGFLLLKVPTITEVDYDNTFQIFNICDGFLESRQSKQTEPLLLKHLTSSNEYLSSSTVDVAVTLCPFLSNLTITNSIMDNELLYKFMVLDHLAHLRLTNNDALSLNFLEGVMPLLTAKGHQLQTLLLSNFSVVDVVAIGECCPKLKNLALSNITLYAEILYPRETLFTNLNALEIWTFLGDETMSGVAFKQLLSFCPDLRNLLVSSSSTLNDKLLLEIRKVNEFKQLNRLTLNNCPNTSSVFLHELLDMSNDLTLLRIWGCFLINREDYKKLSKRIKEENCDTYIEWFPWEG